MWTTHFDHSFDFFEAHDKYKRFLGIIATFSLLFCYFHYFELQAQHFDKLKRALTYIAVRCCILNIPFPTKSSDVSGLFKLI